MTTSKSNTVSLSAKEWVSGDRDLMKTLMKEALQEVLEGEMTEFLGAAPSERAVRQTMRPAATTASAASATRP